MSVIRKTKSFNQIQSFFQSRKEAVKASDLVSFFKDEMNKTTVYRIVSRLEESGFIHSFKAGDGNTWYAKCVGCSDTNHHDNHAHFQCNSCGKVECVEAEIQLKGLSLYKVESQILLLVGKCKTCN